MNIDINKLLTDLGMSQNCASVYECLLACEEAKAQKIAEITGLNRSTVYQSLDVLMKSNLIETIREFGSVTKFRAQPPQKLIHMTDNLIEKYTRLSGNIHMIMPELNARYRGDNPKSKVKYHEGQNGLIKAYEETLSSTEEIRAYASIENMHKALPGYFPEYYIRRADSNIPIKSVHPATEEAVERTRNDKREKRNSCLVPVDEYSFSPEINIFDNKIIFMSLVEKFALVIESRELANAMKKVFDLSWKEAERLNKRIRKDKR